MLHHLAQNKCLINLTDCSFVDKFDVNVIGQVAVLHSRSMGLNQEPTSLLFSPCYWQTPSGTNFSCKIELSVDATCLHIPYWFWARIFSHKYLHSPRLNYKFKQTLETHHLNFTKQFYAPYNAGGLNSAYCQNLRMIFIQKIPRNISSWQLPKYLALNLIMIRFKTVVFSLWFFEHLSHSTTLK